MSETCGSGCGLYICPTSGETECIEHGGFDACCDHPRCPSRMTADHLTREERYAAVIERVLRENGLTDEPHKYGSSIHSWRCEHPDVYGPCKCLQELRDELTAALVADPQTLDNRAYLAGYEFALRNLHDEPVQADLRRLRDAQPDAGLSDGERLTIRNTILACPDLDLDAATSTVVAHIVKPAVERILAARAAQPAEEDQ